jgi:hypothetical protein
MLKHTIRRTRFKTGESAFLYSKEIGLEYKDTKEWEGVSGLLRNC